MSEWDTAANIINDAAIELALISAPISDPYASVDVNIVQLRQHLKSLGQDLVRDYQWTNFQRQHTFTTVAGEDTYPLPVEFLRFIDQTGWNRTQRMPLIGPVSPQGWQQLQVMTSAGVVDIMYRIVGDRLKLFPAPQASDTISYEYISDRWVSNLNEMERPLYTEPFSGAQPLWFDRRLLVCGVKLRWLRAKGFAPRVGTALRLSSTSIASPSRPTARWIWPTCLRRGLAPDGTRVSTPPRNRRDDSDGAPARAHGRTQHRLGRQRHACVGLHSGIQPRRLRVGPAQPAGLS